MNQGGDLPGELSLVSSLQNYRNNGLLSTCEQDIGTSGPWDPRVGSTRPSLCHMVESFIEVERITTWGKPGPLWIVGPPHPTLYRPSGENVMFPGRSP